MVSQLLIHRRVKRELHCFRHVVSVTLAIAKKAEDQIKMFLTFSLHYDNENTVNIILCINCLMSVTNVWPFGLI